MEFAFSSLIFLAGEILSNPFKSLIRKKKKKPPLCLKRVLNVIKTTFQSVSKNIVVYTIFRKHTRLRTENSII